MVSGILFVGEGLGGELMYAKEEERDVNHTIDLPKKFGVAVASDVM